MGRPLKSHYDPHFSDGLVAFSHGQTRVNGKRIKYDTTEEGHGGVLKPTTGGGGLAPSQLLSNDNDPQVNNLIMDDIIFNSAPGDQAWLTGWFFQYAGYRDPALLPRPPTVCPTLTELLALTQPEDGDEIYDWVDNNPKPVVVPTDDDVQVSEFDKQMQEDLEFWTLPLYNFDAFPHANLYQDLLNDGFSYRTVVDPATGIAPSTGAVHIPYFYKAEQGINQDPITIEFSRPAGNPAAVIGIRKRDGTPLGEQLTQWALVSAPGPNGGEYVVDASPWAGEASGIKWLQMNFTGMSGPGAKINFQNIKTQLPTDILYTKILARDAFDSAVTGALPSAGAPLITWDQGEVSRLRFKVPKSPTAGTWSAYPRIFGKGLFIIYEVGGTTPINYRLEPGATAGVIDYEGLPWTDGGTTWDIEISSLPSFGNRTELDFFAYLHDVST